MRLPALALLLCLPACAEEGMWTFDNLPVKALQARWGLTPTQAWADHLRLASLRFPGGSGSFVSPEGLVLTNHHVVRGAIQSLSTRDRDLLKDGFVAMQRDQELKVPGMELMQLVRMEDITARVAAAAKAAPTPAEALRAREREVAAARQELSRATDLTVEPVTLYQGGETWLYVYRKFRDVRLVLAPELAVARFGGDHDNFTYPRHHLDFALLRVYEDGKPFRPEHRLAWSRKGFQPGAPSFITGHPGTTNRLWTVAQMDFAREVGMPQDIAGRQRLRAALEAYAARSFEHRARVGGRIYGLDNGLKAMGGYLATLQDGAAMAPVVDRERRLRDRVKADTALAREVGGSWEAITKALVAQRRLAREQAMVTTRHSELLGTALHVLRLPAERSLPEARRLSEYAEGALPALLKRLTAPRPTPFHADLEVHLLAFGLQDAADQLGTQHPFVKAMLGGRPPEEVARTAVEGSRLQDPQEVKRLLDGGAAAVAASTDPMLTLARRLDPLQRALRAKVEQQVDGPIREHADRIARARFVLEGKATYPDATFTLRLSDGTPKAYPANGTLQAPFTTLGGLFDRFQGWGGTAFNVPRDTWNLPPRWLERRSKLDPDTPYNVATTHDIIGGNSGSPVVDADGALVGVAFDGNLESLGGRYVYDGRANRTISVDARAIREVLFKVYDAAHLVAEFDAK